MAIRFDRRAFTLAAALLLALAWAAGAGAQARVEEKVNLTVTGDIKALDAAARRITVESTSDDGIVYEVDRSATIMSGAQKSGAERSEGRLERRDERAPQRRLPARDVDPGGEGAHALTPGAAPSHELPGEAQLGQI